MGEGHFSPDPLGSSNFRASKQLKTAKNGLFWQFLPIWHSVNQIFGLNHLDLNQKSLTIYGGRYFKSWSYWIQPYFGLKTAQSGPKEPILAVFAYFTFCRPIFWYNHCKYMGEGHFSPDPLGSSNFRASKQLKILTKWPILAVFSHLTLCCCRPTFWLEPTGSHPKMTDNIQGEVF